MSRESDRHIDEAIEEARDAGRDVGLLQCGCWIDADSIARCRCSAHQQAADIPPTGKAEPDYMTDDVVIRELRAYISDLEKRRTEWQLVANDHIIAVRTITEQLQSMHDAWEKQVDTLALKEIAPNSLRRSHSNGYADALCQTAAEVSGLLKAIRSWPDLVRPKV